MKFDTLMQNNMPIMKIWSKSKLEIEIKYGGG